jgi:2-methylisocitrate lyase-like PEP mutase family enzyme
MRCDEGFAHARMIVNATDLPVAADLEGGFGDMPDAAQHHASMTQRD